jgi:hypothetical protein
MMIRYNQQRLLGALALSLILAACGGGGGGGSSGDAQSATNANTSRGASAASASDSTTATASSGTTSADTTTNATPATSTTPATNSSGTSTDAAADTTASSPVASTSPASAAKIFYGANGHNNEGGAYDISSATVQLQQLKDLGATIYRNEVYTQGTAQKLANIARIMAPAGVTVYPVMLMGGFADYASEDAAYAAGFALGQQTATAYAWRYYEVSNELGAKTLTANVDGVYAQQFDNVKYQKARGAIRGLIAGVKSIDASATIVMGGNTWLHYGFDQMLANGTQPDGSAGHPTVDWDITAWHWYSNQGDITNACGGTGCHNVLAELQRLGKPIWMTEFGVRPNFGSDQQIADYLVGNKMMTQFVALASRYNIQSIQVYELYDDPPLGEGAFGLLKDDGVTPKAAYNAFKQFVAANPR